MNIFLYIFILFKLLLITWGDIKFRRIPNLWSLFNIVLAIALFLLYPEKYIFALDSFQFSMAFFVVGFLLFYLKIMGGGDSKYLATFFLLVPSVYQDRLFYYLLIATVMIGIITFANNTISNWQKISLSFKNKDLQGVKSCFGTKFAYAPVILISWLIFGYTLYF